jgi:hypothetical protein
VGKNLTLAKPGGEQRHAPVVAAMMDVGCPSHVMDIVAMGALKTSRMLDGQADGLDDSRSRCCLGFRWRIVAGHKLSGRSAMRCVGLVNRDVEACLLELFLDVKFSTGLELA